MDRNDAGPKRFLGRYFALDGKSYDITEETPVAVLLDVIETLHEEMKREKEHHAGTIKMLRIARGETPQ